MGMKGRTKAPAFVITLETPAERPRFYLEGEEVDLRRSGAGKPFKGRKVRSFDKDPMPFELKMVEPRGTGWHLKIDYGGQLVYEKPDGEVDDIPYSFKDTIEKRTRTNGKSTG